MANSGRIYWKELIFLLVLASFIGFFRWQSLELPMDRDEGTIAYMAKNMSAASLPYKDIFDYRPPLIYHIYKTAFSIFGTSADGIRYFTMLYVIFTALLVYMLARSVSASAFYAMLSSLFYTVFLHNYMMQGLGSYPEMFAQFPILASILFAMTKEKDYEHVSFFLSGFLAATALAIDTTAIFFILAPALYCIFFCGKKRWNSLIWYLAGFLTLIFLAFNWLLYKGVLKEFFDDVISYGTYFIINGVHDSSFVIIKLGMGMFTLQNIVLIAGVLYTGVKAFRRSAAGYYMFLSAAFVTLFSGVMLFRGIYPHYYLILIPVMSLATAVMIKDAVLFMKKISGSKAAMAAATAAVLTAIITFQFFIMKALPYARSGRYTINYYFDLKAAAAMINGSSEGVVRGKNFLFGWPNMPEMYFMTGATAATKYVYSYPLELYKHDRDSVTGVLFNDRPVWAVLEKGKYKAFQAFLDNYYRKEMETETIAVYRNILK